MLLAGCSDAPADGSTAGGTSILNIGTGSVGGTDNTVVEAISSVVNQKTGLKTSTITTNGGTEIIYLLETGDIQAGYSGTIDLINALNGASSFDHAVDPSHMLQCFGFVTWDLPLVVLDNSGIESYEDLAGKRVGLSPVGSSTAEVLMLVLEAYGLTDSVTIENFTWNEGYTALKDGRIDAMVGSWANGDPISGLIELKATKDIRILSMSEEAAQAVAQANAGVSSGVLNSENDDSIASGEEVVAPANSGVIIADASVDEESIYQYTKAVLENLEELKGISNYFDAFEDVCMSVCVEGVPFHPGAAKALKEAGLWEDRFTVYDGV
ncbi:MAG: TAXI family TRAP transporter solute-binding subunit [Ruthenibacterium sp.]